MAQGPLKTRKNAGKPATQRRNKPKVCLNPNKNPAVRKLRNTSKLVKIGKVEKLMVSTASANNEHLVYVQKTDKPKAQPEKPAATLLDDELMD